MALVNNQTALNTVYNHYLSVFAPNSTSTRYDTHKKSELRSVYNSIVKQHKESPLYIIDTSKETREFAVGMKENARQFSNIIASLSADENGDALSQKVAASSDSSLVEAKFIGEPSEIDDDLTFEVTVDKLACSQINSGVYLESDAPVDLPADTYSFDVHLNDTDYEFQFNIGNHDTNIELQNKLETLINRSNIGIEASITQDGEGHSALVLESHATGIAQGHDSIFSVADEKTSKTRGVVDYLGISDIERPASNAEFSLNGVARTASSNNFTVDKKFELNLKGLTLDGNPVSIGLKPDIESMSDNIHQLVNSYNSFISKAASFSGEKVKTHSLINDLKRANMAYKSGLNKLGLSFDEDGRLSVNDGELTKSLESDDTGSYRGTINDFTASLTRKTKQISLDPMNYVQKVVVAYKNPGHGYASPYVTSLYSGMMFNSYC